MMVVKPQQAWTARKVIVAWRAAYKGCVCSHHSFCSWQSWQSWSGVAQEGQTVLWEILALDYALGSAAELFCLPWQVASSLPSQRHPLPFILPLCCTWCVSIRVKLVFVPQITCMGVHTSMQQYRYLRVTVWKLLSVHYVSGECS